MKKLLGMMAVLALFAGPAMAQAPIGTAGAVGVQINVVAYSAIQIAPLPLVMTVNDIQAPGGSPVVNEGTHQATTLFTAVGNAGFSVTVTPAYVSNSVIYTPGSAGSVPDAYPTAYTGGVPVGTPPTNGIGFGLSIENVTDATGYVGYDPTVVGVTTAFSPGVSQGRLKVNTYLDSGRSGIPGPFGGELANVGLYITTLTLTLTP